MMILELDGARRKDDPDAIEIDAHSSSPHLLFSQLNNYN